jgi:hypothetical protein
MRLQCHNIRTCVNKEIDPVPKEPHVPKNAKGTTVRLSHEEYEAWHQIAIARKASTDEGIRIRVRLNDVLVDGLWELLKKETTKTREQIRATLPEALRTPEPPSVSTGNVTQMPKPKKKR